MATLVLTTVGGAVGGPVGAALGALVGQGVDRGVLFRPGVRDGPRLVELAVQTSSYGTPIPRVFGTMRVGGTVIWAAPLRETRSVSRSGKGQPGVAQYSYAASFAVLLSARVVQAIGRVWADGKLLRGAAGDLKVAGAMRLHTGEEDQPVDPLIAAAEGADAPAHRGHAYVVFEDLALADYGNRIPQLTFEVAADAGPVAASAIAGAVAGEVSGAGALMLGGFAASGGSVRAVVEVLAEASGAWLAPVGGRLAWREGGAAERTLRGLTGDTREVAAAGSVPATLSLGHYDAARDYQTGVQRATKRGGGWSEERFELPAVISAAAARGIAGAVLGARAAARTRRTVTLGLDAIDLVPGARVAIEDEAGVWRVAEVSVEAGGVRATLVPIARGAVAAVADAGRVAGAVDLMAGATILHAVELPALDDALLTEPRLLVAAAGTGAGWRSAALLMSLDGGASWREIGSTAAPAVIGVVVEPPGFAPAMLEDRAGTVVVAIGSGMVLGDADSSALQAGANLALVGDELIQFGRAVPLGEDRWRLERLWRGRRGTEAAAGTQTVGDRFVLIEADSVRAVDLPVSALGGTARVIAVGIGDPPGGVEAHALVTGVSVAPPSPVALRAIVAADGATHLSWTRRSRMGWRWLDGVDSPLGEEREAYRVTVTASEDVLVLDTDVPAATIAADWRGGRAMMASVRQRGTWAESPPAFVVVPLITQGVV
jgi:hypothetical protein